MADCSKRDNQILVVTVVKVATVATVVKAA